MKAVLIVHDARTLELVYRSERIGDSITALAWSPDAGTLAVGVGAGVLVVAAVTWERVALLQGLHINTNSVEFDATGQRVLTGSRDGTARLWDLSLPDRKLVRGARGVEVAGIDFAPDERRFAVAYVDGRIEIWDRAARDVLGSLRPTEALDCFAWSPAGSTFGLATDGGPVLLVDARSGRTTGRVPGPCGDGFRFSPDGKRIAIPGSDGVLRVFDAEDGRPLWEARAYAGPPVAPSGLRGGAFSPDGSLIATCAASGEVALWAAASGELVRSGKGTAERYLAVGFSPDGKSLCLWATQPPLTEVWNVEALSSAWIDNDDRPTPPVWSANVERLFTLSTEGGLGVWDARRGRMITLLDSPRMPRAKIAVARDGELVVTACATGVRFWKPRTRD